MINVIAQFELCCESVGVINQWVDLARTFEFVRLCILLSYFCV